VIFASGRNLTFKRSATVQFSASDGTFPSAWVYVTVEYAYDGLRVVLYPNDHRPAHVHVLGAGTEAVFILNCPAGPPTLRGNFGFSTGELNRIASALAGSLTALCVEWEHIHDDH